MLPMPSPSSGLAWCNILARDGEPDSIDCGSGHDVAFVDQHDMTRGCEVVSRAYGRLFAN
jgi:hypothetical protein